MNRRPIIYSLLCIAAYFMLWLLVPKATFLSSPKLAVPGLLVSTILFMGVQIAMVRWLAAINIRPLYVFLSLVVWLVVFAAIVIIVAGPIVAKLPPKFQNMSVLVKYLTVFAMRGGGWTVVASFLVILASVSLGCGLSFLLREKNILLPIAVFAAGLDFWTVLLGGPVSKIVKHNPEVVQAVSAAIPKPGTGAEGIVPMSMIGPGDFIFMAMFFAALVRLKMEPAKTQWLLLPLMSLGMLWVILAPPVLGYAARLAPDLKPVLGTIYQWVDKGFPALVLVMISVVVANRKHFNLQRDEKIATGAVAVILVLLMAIYRLLA